MLRSLSTLAIRATYALVQKNLLPTSIHVRTLSFSTVARAFHHQPYQFIAPILQKSLISNEPTTFLQCNPSMVSQNRSVTKFSLKKGKRKTVKSVIKRFKRLNWGIWIHTKSGRTKKLFKKSKALKKRLKQHVFTNATQSWLLDKMVTKFWRRPKYYVDDPYEPYHKREEYFATRKNPIKSYEM